MSRLGLGATTLMVWALAMGCSDDGGDETQEPTGPEPVTFTADIHPILQRKCGAAGCHDGANAPTLPGHGGADVQEAYQATQNIGLDGQPVYERIVTRISTSEPGFMMPPNYANPPCPGTIGEGGCVTQAELDLIQQWIDQGTPL